jgi:hypothetical protein
LLILHFTCAGIRQKSDYDLSDRIAIFGRLKFPAIPKIKKTRKPPPPRSPLQTNGLPKHD